jgi:hypothetical protein
MMYSVYNPGRLEYDYYQDARTQETLNTEKPTHVPNRTMGATPEQAAWALPSDAIKVGSGKQAIGRVAAKKTAAVLAGVGDDPSTMKIALALGAAFLLWKYVAKPRRSR